MTDRITELLEANNRYLEEARDARVDAKRAGDFIAAHLNGAVEMRLCEAARVQLKPNQLYYFTVDQDCVNCRKAARMAEVLT